MPSLLDFQQFNVALQPFGHSRCTADGPVVAVGGMLSPWFAGTVHGSASSPGSEAGFVLPLSITGALVLLLSSLSMQSLVLHTRQAQAAERTRLQAEDQLASAAQRLAADLQGRLPAYRRCHWWMESPAHDQPPAPPSWIPHAVQQLSIDGQVIELVGGVPSQSEVLCSCS